MEIKKDLTSFLKNSAKKGKNPLVVVLGPTASGKTALSLKIAHQIDGEIISADSRQLYKGMEIGTDIISKEQQEDIPHHMLGITTPDKIITLAEYKDMVLQKIKEIYKRKKIPMLVGGTGLYISAIIEDYQVPRIQPDLILREKLEKEAKKNGPEFIYKKLQKLDKKAAKRIHPNNIRYVIRAIEVAMAKTKSDTKSAKKSKTSSKTKSKEALFDTFMIRISWPREKLYERVNLRVDNQIKRGLIDEVKALIKKKYPKNLPAMSSLGVKEIIPHVKGKSTLEECVEILKRNTRRYAKRQMTWFRRYDRVNLLTPKDLEKFLKQ
jgi:tRNA dimethylallyltransferase